MGQIVKTGVKITVFNGFPFDINASDSSINVFKSL